MNKTKKIAILAIIAMVLTLMPAALFAATTDSDRLAGADRIGTGLAIADAGWETADTVVLAPADQANLVDALAAAPLAGQEDAPILLTFKGSLNADVKAKIEDLGATKVYVVGAISSAVVAEVEAIDGVTAEHLSGANRWDTADAVNAKLTSPAGSFVVGYNAIPDALSVASYAAAENFAIVLTKADGTVDADKLVGSKTYLVGGTAVVKDYAGATRLSGADRFATNKAVAEGLSFEYSKVYVANGLSLVDALAVAPLAAKASAFVALASGSDVAAASAVNSKLSSSSKVIAVGGVNAVSAAVAGKVAYQAPATFGVTGVDTIGLNQIKVTFSQEADKDTAEDETKYVLGGAALTAGTAKAVLSSDKKSVMIYLGTAKDQYSTDAFKVSNSIFSKDLLQKNATFNVDLTFSDVTIPTVASVKASGNKGVNVTFSEAVSIPGGYSDWKIDGQTVNNWGFTSTSSDNGFGGYADVYKLSFGVALSAGSHTLTIPAGTSSSLADSAGFKLAETTVNFTVESVTTKPSIVSVEASDNGAVFVTFDRKMDSSAATAAKYKVNDVQVADAGFKSGSGNKVVKLTVNNLPIGANTILFDYTITDDYGNKLGSSSSDDVRMSFSTVKDTTKPTVTSVIVTSPTTIVVKFSENVNSAYAVNKANYVLKSSSGQVIAIDAPVGTTNTYTITTTGAVELSGSNYTLKVKNITDLASSANTMDDYTATFDGINESNPTVTQVYKQSNAKKVAVYFSEAMDTATITTASNYAYVDNADTVRTLPSGTTVSVGDNSRTVILTFPTSYTTDLSAGADAQYKVKGIVVSNVKDVAGNPLAGVSQTVTPLENPGDDTANGPDYVTNSLKLFADSSKVWAEFEVTQNITDLAIADFRIANQEPDSGYVVGKKVVLNFTDSGKMTAIKLAGITADLDTVANASKNAIGIPVKTVADKVVYSEQIAPKLGTVTVADGGGSAGEDQVILTFSEAIDDTITGLYTDDFTFERDGGILTVLSVVVDGSAVKFQFDGGTFATGDAKPITVKAVASKINIRDLKDLAKDQNLYVPASADTNGSKTVTP